MSDVTRIDVTDRVRGILKESEIILTLNDREIGRVSLTPDCFQFHDGYEIHSHRIFRLDSADVLKHSHYAEDCDMGWC
ncbi:MAG: DUF2553 family protein [Bacillaceae bacterium]|nr:DUF2553 family protein [Bacillaceae bacterium]